MLPRGWELKWRENDDSWQIYIPFLRKNFKGTYLSAQEELEAHLWICYRSWMKYYFFRWKKFSTFFSWKFFDRKKLELHFDQNIWVGCLKKKNTKNVFFQKSKNRDISTQSQYFSLILGQVAVLISTRSPESLSTNGQLWPTFREGFRFQPHKMCTLGSDGDFGSILGWFLPSAPRKTPVRPPTTLEMCRECRVGVLGP